MVPRRVRKEWEQPANLLLAGLIPVLSDLKGLGISNLVRRGAVPLFQ